MIKRLFDKFVASMSPVDPQPVDHNGLPLITTKLPIPGVMLPRPWQCISEYQFDPREDATAAAIYAVVVDYLTKRRGVHYKLVIFGKYCFESMFGSVGAAPMMGVRLDGVPVAQHVAIGLIREILEKFDYHRIKPAQGIGESPTGIGYAELTAIKDPNFTTTKENDVKEFTVIKKANPLTIYGVGDYTVEFIPNLELSKDRPVVQRIRIHTGDGVEITMKTDSLDLAGSVKVHRRLSAAAEAQAEASMKEEPKTTDEPQDVAEAFVAMYRPMLEYALGSIEYEGPVGLGVGYRDQLLTMLGGRARNKSEVGATNMAPPLVILAHVGTRGSINEPVLLEGLGYSRIIPNYNGKVALNGGDMGIYYTDRLDLTFPCMVITLKDAQVIIESLEGLETNSREWVASRGVALRAASVWLKCSGDKEAVKSTVTPDVGAVGRQDSLIISGKKMCGKTHNAKFMCEWLRYESVVDKYRAGDILKPGQIGLWTVEGHDDVQHRYPVMRFEEAIAKANRNYFLTKKEGVATVKAEPAVMLTTPAADIDSLMKKAHEEVVSKHSNSAVTNQITNLEAFLKTTLEEDQRARKFFWSESVHGSVQWDMKQVEEFAGKIAIRLTERQELSSINMWKLNESALADQFVDHLVEDHAHKYIDMALYLMMLAQKSASVFEVGEAMLRGRVGRISKKKAARLRQERE